MKIPISIVQVPQVVEHKTGVKKLNKVGMMAQESY